MILDTHIWAWSLVSPRYLTAAAQNAIVSAQTVCVSAISLFEIAQKVRLGKWEEMAPYAARLPELAAEQEIELISVSPPISLLAAQLDWDHRDPFDRIICATALVEGLKLISADKAFGTLGPLPARIC